jgi:methionine-rich copper-binding protein CopC
VAVALLVASVMILALVVETRPAHLVSARPADGARLASPPSQVELTFSARPDPARSHVNVGSADGKPVPAGAFGVTGERASLPVTVVGDGEYRVAYHMVFDGGRTVSGMLRFAVGAGPVRADAVPAAGGHGHGSVGPGTQLITCVVLAALAVVALLLLRRRRWPTRVGP